MRSTVGFSIKFLTAKPLPEPDCYQEDALNKSGAVKIQACPGSGKTTTMAIKITRLLKEGVSPDSILPLTFSNRAMRELMKRVPAVEAFTFHGLANRRSGRGRRILGPDDQLELIGELYGGNEYEARAMATAIGKAKSEFSDAYPEYERALRERGLIDFYDMLSFFLEDLEDSKFQSKLRKQYRYLIIDEFQDTSMQQYEIILKLADSNVIVVGDPNQSIYRWRNATPENWKRFEKDFSPESCPLLHNYRSGDEIVSFLESIYKVGMEGNGKDSHVFIDEEPESLEGDTYVIARTRKTLGRYAGHLSSYYLRMGEEAKVIKMVGKAPYAELLTAHASKGSEADNVSVIGADCDMFPHHLSTDREEEKNLFYVACSRAKENLYISWDSIPTPFLPREYLPPRRWY